MAFVTPERFRELLSEQTAEKVVTDYVFQGEPYVFRDSPEKLDTVRDHIRANFKVTPRDIIVVGSAKMGFSLNPDNFPRQFSESSDIDIVVVDRKLFDSAWETILKWHYPRRRELLGAPEKTWLGERRKDIFWGWFYPTKIRFTGLSYPEVLKPLRDLSTRWFNVFRGLAHHREFVSRNVSGRLYRTWEHALWYHAEGLRLIKNTIAP